MQATDEHRSASDAASQTAVSTTLGSLQPIALSVLSIAATGALFYLWPQLDLIVSGWFAGAQGGFPWGGAPRITALRDFGIHLTVVTIIALAAIAICWKLRPASIHLWPTKTPHADWWFLALGMAIGPGVLVNLVFKPIWGRARPLHIEQFGGHDHFTPAWVVAHQCHWNCAFYSGEASATAFNLAFALIAPPPWRVPVAVAAIAATVVVSFARLAEGGHFLSDVVTGWLMTLLVLLVLRHWIYGRRPTQATAQ